MPDDLTNASSGLIRLAERPDEKFYIKVHNFLEKQRREKGASQKDVLLALLMLGDPRVEHLQTPEVAEALLEGRDVPPVVVETRDLCGKNLHEMTEENTRMRMKGGSLSRECKECARISSRKRNAGEGGRKMCMNGLHEWVPENLRQRTRAGRPQFVCDPCYRATQRRRKQRQRA